MTGSFPVVTQEQLVRLHTAAWEAGREEHGDRFEIALLPTGVVFPIASQMLLASGLVRCTIVIGGMGRRFPIDLTREEVGELEVRTVG